MNKETLEEAAEKWVFDTNGHRWSNNDDTAGDNYASFKAGANWQAERSFTLDEISEKFFGGVLGDGYMDEWLDYRLGLNGNERNHITFKDWFEQFKKK